MGKPSLLTQRGRSAQVARAATRWITCGIRTERLMLMRFWTFLQPNKLDPIGFLPITTLQITSPSSVTSASRITPLFPSNFPVIDVLVILQDIYHKSRLVLAQHFYIFCIVHDSLTIHSVYSERDTKNENALFGFL